MLEDAKSVQQQSLKEKFTTNNRTKRCVPSDSRISPSVSAPSKSLYHAMDQGRTFCFDVIISATIFARRKSAGGNMIGLNQQRKSHASRRSFGAWVWAHFPEQWRGMSVGSFSRTAAGNRTYSCSCPFGLDTLVLMFKCAYVMYVYVWTIMSNPYLRPQNLKNRKDDVN